MDNILKIVPHRKVKNMLEEMRSTEYITTSEAVTIISEGADRNSYLLRNISNLLCCVDYYQAADIKMTRRPSTKKRKHTSRTRTKYEKKTMNIERSALSQHNRKKVKGKDAGGKSFGWLWVPLQLWAPAPAPSSSKMARHLRLRNPEKHPD